MSMCVAYKHIALCLDMFIVAGMEKCKKMREISDYDVFWETLSGFV